MKPDLRFDPLWKYTKATSSTPPPRMEVAGRRALWADTISPYTCRNPQGGPPPEDVLMRHPAARAASPSAITSVIATLIGGQPFPSPIEEHRSKAQVLAVVKPLQA